MYPNDQLVSPFLKWVGGKRQLLPQIIPLLPKHIYNYQYVEPFIGGGALFFHLQPQNAIINDFNEELVNAYAVIKNQLPALLQDLKKHENTESYFYNIRGLDRETEYKNVTNVQRASRIIYLNKTCFNGLYRVNKAGHFNVPYGKYKNPKIINEETLTAINAFLNKNTIEILNGDYATVLQNTNKKSFVYLDPPYDPVSQSSSFTSYIKGGWNKDTQIALREACDMLHKKGVKFLLSNAATDFIKEQYKAYDITIVKAKRSINADGANRGVVDEVLIRNYGDGE